MICSLSLRGEGWGEGLPVNPVFPGADAKVTCPPAGPAEL
jgi:hypothetical protein